MCSAGSCTDNIAADATFFVRVTRASVDERKTDGSNWDPFGGLPDLFVCAGDSPLAGCTGAPCPDASSCNFAPEGLIRDASGNPVVFRGADLAAGLSLRVWDDDVDGDDPAGQGRISLSRLAASYSTGRFGAVQDVVIEIY